MLAAQADARWAAKRSALDAPDKQQPIQMLKSKDPDSGIVQMNANQDVRDRSEAQVTEEAQTTSQPSAQSQNMPQDPPEPPAAEGAPTLQTRKWMKKEPKDSPWNKARQAGPGEDWQPRGWSPAPNKRRA